MRIRVSRRLPAPADQVWALLTDWPRQREWMPATTIRVLPGPREGLGTRLEAVTGVGLLRVVDPMEVVVWQPPVRCVMRHDGGVLTGTGTFEIEPLNEGASRMTWREDLAPASLPARVAAAVAARLAVPFFAWALRRLDRLVRSTRQ